MAVPTPVPTLARKSNWMDRSIDRSIDGPVDRVNIGSIVSSIKKKKINNKWPNTSNINEKTCSNSWYLLIAIDHRSLLINERL